MPTKLVQHTKYDWAAMWLSFLAGATLEEIATMYNVPYGSIVKYSSAHYWKQRRATAKARAMKATTGALTERIQRSRIDHQNFVLDTLDKSKDHIAELEIGNTKEDIEQGKVRPGHLLNLLDQHDQIARRTLKLDDDATTNPLEAGFAFLVALGKQSGQQQLTDVVEGDFVNESIQAGAEGIQDAEIVSETEKVVQETQVTELEKQPEITPSAITPLPVDSDAITGNNRPIIGHILGRTQSEIAPNPEPFTEPMPKANRRAEEEEIKPMPDSITFR